MKTKISVIIPTFNRANFLPRAIKSVLNQTFQDLELIVVDDGSTDNTEEVVRRFQKMNRRIRYIKQEHSGGAARPKNTGLKESVGEYIATLDSDDEWLPTKLEKQLDLFEKSANPNLGFVGCYYIAVNEFGSKEELYKIPQYIDTFRSILTHDYMGSGSCIIYKRKVFDNAGYFDENLKTAQDWEMRIRLVQKYDFDFVREPLVKYFIHMKNITKTLDDLNRIQDHKYILRRHKALYKKYPKAYSTRIRNIGSMHLLAGNSKKACRYFIEAIKVAPLWPRSYVNLTISLFGNKFYKKILYRKRKIAGDFSLG